MPTVPILGYPGAPMALVRVGRRLVGLAVPVGGGAPPPEPDPVLTPLTLARADVTLARADVTLATTELA